MVVAPTFNWIYVDDHCEVWEVFVNGRLGEHTALVRIVKRNVDAINEICDIMSVEPQSAIKYVQDRLGHDQRYAIDNSKIVTESFKPKTTFAEGIAKTIMV